MIFSYYLTSFKDPLKVFTVNINIAPFYPILKSIHPSSIDNDINPEEYVRSILSSTPESHFLQIIAILERDLLSKLMPFLNLPRKEIPEHASLTQIQSNTQQSIHNEYHQRPLSKFKEETSEDSLNLLSSYDSYSTEPSFRINPDRVPGFDVPSSSRDRSHKKSYIYHIIHSSNNIYLWKKGAKWYANGSR